MFTSEETEWMFIIYNVVLNSLPGAKHLELPVVYIKERGHNVCGFSKQCVYYIFITLFLQRTQGDIYDSLSLHFILTKTLSGCLGWFLYDHPVSFTKSRDLNWVSPGLLQPTHCTGPPRYVGSSCLSIWYGEFLPNLSGPCCQSACLNLEQEMASPPLLIRHRKKTKQTRVGEISEGDTNLLPPLTNISKCWTESGQKNKELKKKPLYI